MQHDGKIDIATGRSRHETAWKNKAVLWSELVKRISTTHRTPETYDEYIASKPGRQDEIKDVGGFVGAYLQGGKRRKGSAVHRQLLTLDIDFYKSNVWEDFTLLYGNAAAIYSTHKHNPQAPRYRLLIPLSREVFADEYIAIARKVAGSLNIENFDNTTFQPERLMYWPSTAKDGEFFTDSQDGPWLDADAVLRSYRDWTDSSEWPVSARYTAQITREIKKQGDPLEKPGLIGAFCRTYTIEAAIEKFLADVYEACDAAGRYTYKEGSTSGGLILYDDKYAYSHHGTDPASNKLCNAFDLVRLHLFGLKDEDAKPDTQITKLPSFTAMTDFCMKDKDVRKRVAGEKFESAKQDFIDADLGNDDAEPENPDWMEGLEVNRKGVAFSTINNIVTVLNNDPKLKGSFAFNDFEKREIALRDLPWRKLSKGKYLTDKDDAALRHYFENVYGISGIQKIRDGVDIVLMANVFHPVRDYLKALKWDGVGRVDTLLVDYMGADDSPYTRAVTRKWLAAAVARIFEPGVKFDNVLTLIGAQGRKKSMLFDKLGREWYSDSFTTVQGTGAFEQLQGTWIMEMAELAGLRRADVETVKHFVSKREDRYRVAYGRRLEYFPRQCVFGATTNDRTPLQDSTGGRRWWVVKIDITEPVKDPFVDMTTKEIGQIWAEAVHYYNQDEPLYLTGETEKRAQIEQLEATDTDERAGLVRNYLNTLLPTNWESMDVYERREFLKGGDLIPEGTIKRKTVCALEIWVEVMGGSVKDFKRLDAKAIHDIMRNMKYWEPANHKQRVHPYGVQRVYNLYEKFPIRNNI